MSWQRFMEIGELHVQNEDELLDELYRHMYIIAYAKTRNRDKALDIVQESWVKILQKVDTLKDPQKLVQWAKVIAANTALNIAKRKDNEWLPLIDDGFNIGDLGADIHLEEKETKKAVYRGLEVLHSDERKIVICKFYYNWRDAQIAEAMEMPVGTVKAKLHRAKKKLRNYLIAHFGQDAASDQTNT